MTLISSIDFSSFNGFNDVGYGSDGDNQTSVTKSGITGIAGASSITTETQKDYAGQLDNVFDEPAVTEEIAAQVQITK